MFFNRPEGIEKTPEQHSSELEVEKPIQIYNGSVRAIHRHHCQQGMWYGVTAPQNSRGSRDRCG